MSESPAHTARELMEVVPLVMRTFRAEMRGSRANDLSVPQFRALGFVHRKPGTSLSDVAEHIGLALPSMSKLIDGLVLFRDPLIDDPLNEAGDGEIHKKQRSQ